jgi:hypothetical protein
MCQSEDPGAKCDKMYDDEMDNCYENYGLWGYDNYVFQGCKQRARIRWDICLRKGGNMPADAPPPWSDADVDGTPTIHDKKR